MDSEIEELPTDYVRGLDFKIVKTSKGGYADYSTSTWARRERALNNDENAAIEQYGLFNLQDFLPKKPSEVELKVMKEMFEASVDGEAFDMDRWGQYFKPAGMGGSGSSTGETAPASSSRNVSTPAVTNDDNDTSLSTSTPESGNPSAGGDASDRAKDILAMIRSRQQAN